MSRTMPEETTLERVTMRGRTGQNRDRAAELAAAIAVANAGMQVRAQVHVDEVALRTNELLLRRVMALESGGTSSSERLGRAEAQLEHAQGRIAQLEAELASRPAGSTALETGLSLANHIAGLLATDRLHMDAAQIVAAIRATHGQEGAIAFLEAVAVSVQNYKE